MYYLHIYQLGDNPKRVIRIKYITNVNNIFQVFRLKLYSQNLEEIYNEYF